MTPEEYVEEKASNTISHTIKIILMHLPKGKLLPLCFLILWSNLLHPPDNSICSDNKGNFVMMERQDLYVPKYMFNAHVLINAQS